MTIVCGDSHTSTHGAMGAIAFGIGTSEVEMVLASQCVLQSRPKTMRITVDGKLGKGVTAKDVALYMLSLIHIFSELVSFKTYDLMNRQTDKPKRNDL